MKYQKTITSIAFLLLGLGGLHAQESLTAAGGEATGTGGTASYSIGQVVYTTAAGTNGSVTQGVQQPFDIDVVEGINKTIQLELSVYPNPTTDYLTLKTEDNANLSYQLYDIQGKVIKTKKISEKATTIEMEGLPIATYFLKVAQNNQIVKTFKIIKQ